jgi:DNA-binding GntR family transcriptional regulator
MSDTLIPRSSLNAQVIARLRSEIVEGVWRPGVRLQERLLCQRYGVSRSPLREAYQAMVAEGLLEISPNRGAVVSSPSPKSIAAHYVLLGALEVLAIELACDEATDAEIDEIIATNNEMKAAGADGDLSAFLHANNEVHRKLVAASGNAPLVETHKVISRQIIRVQNLSGPIEHTITESIDEHDEFLDALRRRQKAKAGQALGRHLKTVEENLTQRLAPYSEAAAARSSARGRAARAVA